jgi:protein tyrosine phosphatase (PTP) superfamily phosphohydrolase (DUF442 family)
MGINFKKLGNGFEQFGKTVGTELGEAGKAAGNVVKDLAHGNVSKAGTDAKNAAVDLGESAFDAGASAIGVAEMLGIRYPVKTYESKLDTHVTRGSRLSDTDMARLHNQGYKGVVNLCLENNDDAARAHSLGMNDLHLEILDNAPPTQAQVKQFLDFVTAPANQPAYFHCEAGQGRTGVMAAAYRMAVEGWTADQAITEGKQFGLKVPSQIEFLQQLGADLQAGKIAGYPLHP